MFLENPAGSLEIVDMRPEHIPEVKAIEIAEKLSQWTPESYREEICSPDSYCVVAIIDGNVVGFLLARLITASTSIEIYNFAVSRRFHRKHIGSALFRALMNFGKLKRITEISLEVRKSNESARKFYDHLGFDFEYERKSFYSNPTEDALILVFRQFVKE